MNSAADTTAKTGWAFALLALLALAPGCSDRGPTDIYSKTLFGVSQQGASLQAWHPAAQFMQVDSNGDTRDGIQVYLINQGQSSTFGPVKAWLSTSTPGATVLVASAQAGNPGREIRVGDAVPLYSVDSNGNFLGDGQSFEVDLTATSAAYTLKASDPYGHTWTSSFNLNEVTQ